MASHMLVAAKFGRKEAFFFSFRFHIGNGLLAGLSLRCIKYNNIKCIFACEAKCSASPATTKTRSSTFQAFSGVSWRLTLRKREGRKKLRSLRAPATLCLLNSERPALRKERNDQRRRAALCVLPKQSPADCQETGFHASLQRSLPPAAAQRSAAQRILPMGLRPVAPAARASVRGLPRAKLIYPALLDRSAMHIAHGQFI